MDFKTSFIHHQAFLMEALWVNTWLKREYGLMPDKSLALAKHVYSLKGRECAERTLAGIWRHSGWIPASVSGSDASHAESIRSV